MASSRGSAMTSYPADAPGDGLMEGVDVTNSDMYNENLEYWDPLLKRGYLMKAAELDAVSRNCTVDGYVGGLKKNYAEFLASGHIADRNELKKCFETTIRDPKSAGEISIVWGPKSTGKTKLLEKMCSESTVGESNDDVLVIYVNARTDTLAKGIAKAIDEISNNSKAGLQVPWEKIAESFPGIISAASTVGLASPGVAGTAKAVVTGAMALHSLVVALSTCGSLGQVEADLGLLDGFLVLAQKLNKHPSLVIDEANLVVTGEADNKLLLSSICSKTKEHREMNVTLCTSSHTYPHKLAKLEGLQLQHTVIQYAPELPPKEMWNFLTKEEKQGTQDLLIGMGDHLARACMSACGGNIFLVGRLLEKANDPQFKILRCLTPIEGRENIQDLLNDTEVEPILMGLAQKGYHLITSSKSESVKKIIDARVAGIVESEHLFPSKLKGILDDDEYGMALAPSSEALRHLIRFEIVQKRRGGTSGMTTP